METGYMCIVLNAKDISITGRKMTDNIYYWHTGSVRPNRIIEHILFKIIVNFLLLCVFPNNMYVSHLKERRLKDQMEKDPIEVIHKAVLRMLPRNRLCDERDRMLRIFSGSDHPYHDRPFEPFVMPAWQVREMRGHVQGVH
uniref:50S ribosomal protein L13 n=1 Tax=Arundo donax TaxID=35708 RepID=A0A0A9BV50_ARUDO